MVHFLHFTASCVLFRSTREKKVKYVQKKLFHVLKHACQIPRFAVDLTETFAAKSGARCVTAVFLWYCLHGAVLLLHHCDITQTVGVARIRARVWVIQVVRGNNVTWWGWAITSCRGWGGDGASCGCRGRERESERGQQSQISPPPESLGACVLLFWESSRQRAVTSKWANAIGVLHYPACQGQSPFLFFSGGKSTHVLYWCKSTDT